MSLKANNMRSNLGFGKFVCKLPSCSVRYVRNLAPLWWVPETVLLATLRKDQGSSGSSCKCGCQVSALLLPRKVGHALCAHTEISKLDLKIQPLCIP